MSELPLNSLDNLLARLQSKPAMTPAENIFRTTFPQRISGYEVREQQIQMARLIEDALASKQHVMAEAGTGTGKSFAYLLPVALHIQEKGGRAIVSTGTITLQEQLLGKDIPFLEKTLGMDFGARLAKGKSNYICRVKLHEELRQPNMFEEDRLLKAIVEWANKPESTGDRSDIPFQVPGEVWSRVCVDDSCPGKRCPVNIGGNCFYYQAKAKFQDAKLIVCNHALFFTDLKVRDDSDGYAAILPEYQVVVFDEAHHLEQIARETLSMQISAARLPVLLAQLRKLEGCDQGAVQEALAANEQFFGAVALSGNGAERWIFKPDDKLQKLHEKLQDAVLNVGLSVARLDVDERVNKLTKLLGDWELDLHSFMVADREKNHVFWVENSKNTRGLHLTLHATPIDVSSYLSSLFHNEEITSIIMTSATLSAGGSFSYLKKAIGCDECREICVDSPFDYYNQCLLYLPPGLPDPNKPDFHEKVAPVIEEILLKTDGRAFVLFTSYRGMNEVYNRLAGRLRWTVLKQGDMPKQMLLEQFKRDVNSVLFATASFWEGVDVQGESLSCVILVKLPFAVPDDPITEAKIKAIERAGGNSFMEYSVPEAIIRLKQGFGRLIRTKADRGIVAILDPRVKTKGYGRKFLNSLPRCREISSLENVDLFLKRNGEQRKPVIQADWGSGKSFTAMIVLPGLGIENFKKDA